MTSLLTPQEALSRIPGWENRSPRIGVIEGGLTNRTYKVSSNGEDFVLRLDSEHGATLRLDRETEAGIVGNASAQGLAPQLLYSDPGAGITLTEFIDGELWTRRKFDDARMLESLAGLLRRVHGLPKCGVSLDVNVVVEKYVGRLAGAKEFSDVVALCQRVAADIPSTEQRLCCHNDVVAGNIIARPGLMLLDWEYACDNDPLYDLACAIGFHDLGKALRDTLLGAYAGSTAPELLERLQLQMRLFDAIQCLWFASRQLLAPTSAQRRRIGDLQARLG